MKPLTMEAAEQLLRDAIEADDREAIDQWAALVDRLEAQEATKPIPTIGTAAIWYASQGLRVFPLARRSKIPRKGSHGLDDATADVGTVASWWAREPHANVAIATGRLVDVIDIDGVKGEKSLAELRGELGESWPDPDTLGIVSTPTAGGRHFYVPTSARGNAANIAEKVDVRGAGGYVVAPPSVTPGGAYVWLRLLDTARMHHAGGHPYQGST